jgi:hypothetical protein
MVSLVPEFLDEVFQVYHCLWIWVYGKRTELLVFILNRIMLHLRLFTAWVSLVAHTVCGYNREEHIFLDSIFHIAPSPVPGSIMTSIYYKVGPFPYSLCQCATRLERAVKLDF